MQSGDQQLSGFVRRMIVMQAAMAAAISIPMLAMAGVGSAAALALGVLVMVGNGAWMGSGIAQLGTEKGGGAKQLYRDAALRFAALISLLTLFWMMGLNLLLVALGMGLAQGLVFAAGMVMAWREYRKDRGAK